MWLSFMQCKIYWFNSKTTGIHTNFGQCSSAGKAGLEGAALLVAHLLSAVSTVQNAGQRVRLAADALPDTLGFPQTLDNIPCFPVNNGGVGVLENQPVFLRGSLLLLGFLAFRLRGTM